MSRHVRKNDDTHMAYGQQVMRYLKRTRTKGLTLRASSDLQLRSERPRASIAELVI